VVTVDDDEDDDDDDEGLIGSVTKYGGSVVGFVLVLVSEVKTEVDAMTASGVVVGCAAASVVGGDEVIVGKPVFTAGKLVVGALLMAVVVVVVATESTLVGIVPVAAVDD
jgi:hypothetical protein